MSTLAIMALMTVISTAISFAASKYQQDKEFGQQQQLQQDAQEFQAQREDLMYQRNSIPNQFQQMLDSGFNPNLAAASLMGGNSVSAASSGSSPSAPTTNSAIGALQSMFGQGGQNLFDMFKDNAEIQNIQADTQQKEIQSGLMPRDYLLREMTTLGQLKVWDASVERTKAAQHLDEEQTKYVQNQNLYYGRMAEAQIDAYEAQTNKAYSEALLALEQINTEKAKQTELASETALNEAKVETEHAQAIYLGTLNSTEYYKSESARIAQEFEKKLGNIPLTADAQKYVQSLAEDGDIEGMKNFYMNVFTTAKNQQLGTEYGTNSKFGLPFNLYQGRPNTGLGHTPFGWSSSSPVWNPNGNLGPY